MAKVLRIPESDCSAREPHYATCRRCAAQSQELNGWTRQIREKVDAAAELAWLAITFDDLTPEQSKTRIALMRAIGHLLTAASEHIETDLLQEMLDPDDEDEAGASEVRS